MIRLIITEDGETSLKVRRRGGRVIHRSIQESLVVFALRTCDMVGSIPTVGRDRITDGGTISPRHLLQQQDKSIREGQDDPLIPRAYTQHFPKTIDKIIMLGHRVN